MASSTSTAPSSPGTAQAGTPFAASAARPLRTTDLDAVVAIDAAWVGRSRRPYFERRLARALEAPELHAQFGIEGPDGLVGFVLGRHLEGEFGRPEPRMRFETLGVAPDAQGRGAGPALLEALVAETRRRGARAINTSAAWTDHRMLRFLERTGFQLAKSQILECVVGGSGPQQDVADEEGALALDIVTLQEAHIPALARIDAKLTGKERTDYFRRKVEESLHESGVSASLGARHDGHFVGFLTARVDLGDAGHTEPVAVIDTLGVDPAFGGRGVARALFSQLFMNLRALRVERVETMVARDDFALLAFIYRAGFEPSQRLAFTRAV
jgi:ribosomal protein S18 acetylase RimI-like enzyme